MRDIFRRLLLNYESENFDTQFRDIRARDRFVFDPDVSREPWSQDLPSSSTVKTSYLGSFNSDTKLSALGGLSIWQFTAVILASLFGFGLLFCALKRLALCLIDADSEEKSTNTSLNSDCYECVHTTYSIDSSDQLLDTSYSTQVKLLSKELI